MVLEGKASKSNYGIHDSSPGLFGSQNNPYAFLFDELIFEDKAAAIYDIGLSVPLVQANMGKYLDYCPVSYVDHSQLKKGPNSLRFMAEYNVSFIIEY